MTASREIQLAARPRGMPQPTDFALVEVDVPEPADGEVLIRNAYMSVDPYMRGRMNDVKSYVPPFQLGEALNGGAVGQVVASRNDRFAEGTWVVHNLGWRELALSDGRGLLPFDPVARARVDGPRRARDARSDRLRRAARHRPARSRARRCSSRARPARSDRRSGRSRS